MKYLLIIMISVVVLSSCDDTEKFFEELNLSPHISFTYERKEINVLQDSIKLFSGSARSRYSTSISVQDPEQMINGVNYDLISGNGRLSLVNVNDQEGTSFYTMYYYPYDYGFHEIKVIVDDFFDATDTVTIQLEVFDNLRPVAALSVAPARVVDDYEFILDASDSYDRDEAFGGGIEEYEFSINATVFTVKEPSIRYVFSGEGIYSIGVRVKDNDGVWSDRYQEIFAIN